MCLDVKHGLISELQIKGVLHVLCKENGLKRLQSQTDAPRKLSRKLELTHRDKTEASFTHFLEQKDFISNS